MYCTLLAGNAGRKISPFWAPSHNFVGLCLRNEGTYRQSEKYLLSSNISSTCSHNMVNFGLLAAETCWRVWGTPANFNGFRILAALLHGTPVVGVTQTVALNRGRHLYLAGRPSRWALAHILVGLAFPASCVQHISDLHSKFALGPHHAWKYGRHPICDG